MFRRSSLNTLITGAVAGTLIIAVSTTLSELKLKSNPFETEAIETYQQANTTLNTLENLAIEPPKIPYRNDSLKQFIEKYDQAELYRENALKEVKKDTATMEKQLEAELESYRDYDNKWNKVKLWGGITGLILICASGYKSIRDR